MKNGRKGAWMFTIDMNNYQSYRFMNFVFNFQV